MIMSTVEFMYMQQSKLVSLVFWILKNPQKVHIATTEALTVLMLFQKLEEVYSSDDYKFFERLTQIYHGK